MNNLVRSLRSSVRSHTPDGEGDKLKFHILLSVVFGIFTVALALTYNHSEAIIDNLALLIRFVGTIFALLFTILAIILAFQGQYSENRAINELQRTGHYRSIFRRFYLSVFSLGILFISYSAAGIFGIFRINFEKELPFVETVINLTETTAVFLISAGFLLTVLRMSTCFIVYYRIETIMRNQS